MTCTAATEGGKKVGRALLFLILWSGEGGREGGSCTTVLLFFSPGLIFPQDPRGLDPPSFPLLPSHASPRRIWYGRTKRTKPLFLHSPYSGGRVVSVTASMGVPFSAL